MKNFLLLFLAFAIQLFGNNELQAKVPCNLPAPKNLNFTQTSNSSGTVSWNTVSGAKVYKVKLFDVTDLKNPISVNIVDSPSVLFTNLKVGVIYQVQVSAGCDSESFSPNTGFLNFSTIIIDEVCVRSGLPKTICDNPRRIPFKPSLVYQMPGGAIGDTISIKYGSLGMTVGVVDANHVVVFGGIVTNSNAYKTYKLSNMDVTISGTPATGLLITTTRECTVALYRCRGVKIMIQNETSKGTGKQANTSNNPTTLETTDKSELQAAAETNEIQAENLQIAPNPFENYLRLNFENATIKQISLVNQLGQIVKSPAPQQEKNGILDIDTSDLRAGYYYCIVKTESKDYLFKVVKIE